MKQYYPSPQVVAGFLRGLWAAFVAGGSSYFLAIKVEDERTALYLALGVAFAALAGRTGEGGYDSKQSKNDERYVLTPKEKQIMENLRSGKIVLDPDATLE